MKTVRYTSGYRYQLEEPFTFRTGCKPLVTGGNHFVQLDDNGLLSIARGYAWDGASGPTINTRTFVRGSLVHDALYQLIRLGIVAREDRQLADKILYDVVREDGMWPIRAYWVYTAVRLAGWYYLDRTVHTVLEAP